jgi:hypothetical protein
MDAFGGEAAGEEHGVLLGDADVEKLPSGLLGEFGEAGAGGHGAGDADDARVGLGEACDHRLAEDILVRRAPPGALCLAGGMSNGLVP